MFRLTSLQWPAWKTLPSAVSTFQLPSEVFQDSAQRYPIPRGKPIVMRNTRELLTLLNIMRMFVLSSSRSLVLCMCPVFLFLCTEAIGHGLFYDSHYHHLWRLHQLRLAVTPRCQIKDEGRVGEQRGPVC